MERLDFTANGERFLIEGFDGDYAWFHLGYGDRPVEYAHGFATAAEAQQEALRYLEGWERFRAEDADEAEDDGRHGTYEQQVRSTFYDNCL